MKKWREKIKRKDLKYETNNYVYDFQQFETTRYFGYNIYTGKFIIDEAEIDQNNLLESMVEFNNNTRPKKRDGKEKTEILLIV